MFFTFFKLYKWYKSHICIKQYLSNIWNSNHEKIKQHWDWVEKSDAYNKKRVAVLKNFRSSCSQMFFKKGVLEKFAKFTEKHLCWSLFFNQVACFQPTILVKKKTPAQVFSCEFCEIELFFTEHHWLLLKLCIIPRIINCIKTAVHFCSEHISWEFSQNLHETLAKKPHFK